LLAPTGSRTHKRTLRVATRVAQVISVVVGVVVVTFSLIHLVPGDPALSILGQRATPESLAALRAELGVDQPVLSQFGAFVGDLAHGDLGTSIVQDRAVTDIVLPSVGVTFAVIGATVLFSLAIGVPLGLLAALTRFRAVDAGVRVFSVVLLSMPPFFLGLVLLLTLALGAGLAPAGGWGTGWPDNLRYVWLPSLALAGYLAPIIARSVRQSAREIVDQQFIEAAQARGLPFGVIVARHVLPNTLLPVVTLVGFNVAGLVGGAVVIEAVFALPGVGTDLVTAVASRDYPVVQGIALITAVLVVFINAVTDLLYAVIDPRTRAG
jgi:peptide/nickel transport system permease protein